MNDKPDFSIEIQIKDDDINVLLVSEKEFVLSQKDKSLLLIALYHLKEKIKNNQLNIEVQEC